jgi:hypothetical protein
MTDMTYGFAYPPLSATQRALNEANRLMAIAIFERCARHLLKQGRQSRILSEELRVGNIFAYRGDDGLMCGVGCLIADEHYSPELEAQSVDSNIVRYALRRSGVEVDTRWFVGPDCYSVSGMLQEVQELHDGAEPETWYDEAVKIAEQFGLTKMFPLPLEG